jgi:hypothetical protein
VLTLTGLPARLTALLPQPIARPSPSSSYLQFFFNLSLVLILLYLALQFILTVRADIQRKVDEASFGPSPSPPSGGSLLCQPAGSR